MTGKKILIHIGPHKTGTTAIQRMLVRNQGVLAARGRLVLRGRETKALALTFAKEKFDRAEEALRELKQVVSESAAEHFILSQEDFAGDLPGRGHSMRIYPTLTKNVRMLTRLLRPFQVRILFFQRDEDDWLRSCYLQNLRHRDQFSDFEDFRASVEEGFTWEGKLRPAREAIGDDFIVVPYSKGPLDGIGALLEASGLPAEVLREMDVSDAEQNVSLVPDTQREFERLNRRTSVRSLIPVYKARLQTRASPDRPLVVPTGQWPPAPDARPTPGLEALALRTERRVSARMEQPDTLPPDDVDLSALADATLPADAVLPDIDRRETDDQAEIRKYQLRGGSELSYLNALCISYLRRSTTCTQRARLLFHRIWTEQGLRLVPELSTRCLISVLQTFYDHPANEHQRVIGAAGYFYSSMLKIYEGERALEGRPPDALYPGAEPSTDSGFWGLDRYSVGGTDLLLNTNALALEIALLDPVAGLVLEEFLLRTKKSSTVFSRNDASKVQFGPKEEYFRDTWAFSESPEQK